MQKRASSVGRVLGWLAGASGAALVFFGTVPPEQALDNLRRWAELLGLPLGDFGADLLPASIDFGFTKDGVSGAGWPPMGLLDYFRIGGVILLIFAFAIFRPKRTRVSGVEQANA